MIHLICTLEPVRIPFLFQFIEHYKRLGVEKFHFSVQAEPRTSTADLENHRRAARRELSPLGIELSALLVQPFNARVLRSHHDELQSRQCRAGDWIVWADIDEFQVYPGQFLSLLNFADAYGVDYFEGHLIDRVSQDGNLREFDPVQSIWQQYPRVVKPPSPISPRSTHKVVCARSDVRLTPGNHYAAGERPLRYYAESAEIHHFKWDSSVVKRLSRRLQPDFQATSPWWVESKAILDLIETHAGGLGEL